MRATAHEVGEGNGDGAADADADEHPEEEERAEGAAEGGEEAEAAAEGHGDDDGLAAAEDVRDDAPEEGPHEGAPEDAGGQERHLRDGEAEGALAVLAHGREDEGDRQELRLTGGILGFAASGMRLRMARRRRG